MDSLHDDKEERLQDLRGVGGSCPQPGLDQPQDHEDTLVLEVVILRGQLLNYTGSNGLHHLEGTQQHVGLQLVNIVLWLVILFVF